VRALIIDAGNSRIRAVSWSGTGDLPRPDSPGRMPALAPLSTLGDWATPGQAERLPDELVRLLEGSINEPAVLVSVIPRVTEMLRDVRPDLVVVDHLSGLPFVSEVSAPAAVGPDRYCNVAAAFAAGLSNALIVDAGTATTFDLLQEGIFRGGMIAPGMAFAARRIGEEAARLEPVVFEPRSWDVGRDTASAMAAGAWHVGVGGVGAVIDGLIRRYGPLTVILTGGLGDHISWEGAWHDPYWTMRGAAFLGL